MDLPRITGDSVQFLMYSDRLSSQTRRPRLAGVHGTLASTVLVFYWFSTLRMFNEGNGSGVGVCRHAMKGSHREKRLSVF